MCYFHTSRLKFPDHSQWIVKSLRCIPGNIVFAILSSNPTTVRDTTVAVLFPPAPGSFTFQVWMVDGVYAGYVCICICAKRLSKMHSSTSIYVLCVQYVPWGVQNLELHLVRLPVVWTVECSVAVLEYYTHQCARKTMTGCQRHINIITCTLHTNPRLGWCHRSRSCLYDIPYFISMHINQVGRQLYLQYTYYGYIPYTTYYIQIIPVVPQRVWSYRCVRR